tara:strand:- start:403 stop:726 length:324 start_codon:yes stop_codon:yes gene_type:complete
MQKKTNKQNKLYDDLRRSTNIHILKSVNSMRRILESIRESGGRYITLGEIDDLEDAMLDTIKFYNLKKQGGIPEYEDNGKYQEFWHSDYVSPTHPNAFDPKKVKEDK